MLILSPILLLQQGCYCGYGRTNQWLYNVILMMSFYGEFFLDRLSAKVDIA